MQAAESKVRKNFTQRQDALSGSANITTTRDSKWQIYPADVSVLSESIRAVNEYISDHARHAENCARQRMGHDGATAEDSVHVDPAEAAHNGFLSASVALGPGAVVAPGHPSRFSVQLARISSLLSQKPTANPAA